MQNPNFLYFANVFGEIFTIFAFIILTFMNILRPNIPAGLCSDHAGFELKNHLEGYLKAKGIEFNDFGTDSADSCDYPDFAHPCAVAVEEGRCFPGIAMCGTGNGIAITLNKHQGIRAALCWNVELAKLARAHNDANVLVMPARFISAEEAEAIVDAFLSTPFDGGRHARRVEKIPVGIDD